MGGREPKEAPAAALADFFDEALAGFFDAALTAFFEAWFVVFVVLGLEAGPLEGTGLGASITAGV